MEILLRVFCIYYPFPRVLLIIAWALATAGVPLAAGKVKRTAMAEGVLHTGVLRPWLRQQLLASLTDRCPKFANLTLKVQMALNPMLFANPRSPVDLMLRKEK
jgi:hypothetical protein